MRVSYWINCFIWYLLDPDSGFDFKLDDFFAGLCETFDPHYGVGGYQGDGDITKPENIDAFREYVLQLTDGEGVHFVMADGVRISDRYNKMWIRIFLSKACFLLWT